MHMKHEALFCLQSDTWHLFTHNKKKFFQTSCCMRVSDVLSVISKGQNSCVSKRSVNHYEEHRMISITVSQMILHTYNSIWTWVTASKHLNILQYLMVSPPAGSQHIFKIIFISYHNTVIYFSVFFRETYLSHLGFTHSHPVFNSEVDRKERTGSPLLQTAQ